MKKKSGSSFAPVPAILNALDDLKVQNPVTLDVRGQSDMFDTLIIASGTSSRQVRALAQHVMEELKKKGFPPSGYEGLDAGEWALIDYGDIVVHVMLPDIRSFYDIEGLWQVPVVAATPTGTTKATTAKKSTSPTKRGTDSSSAVEKPVAKKAVIKKAVVKKAVVKKTVEKKTVEKQTIEKKTTDKQSKTTTRATASKKPVGQPKTSSKTTTRTGTHATPATRSKTATPKKTTTGSATTRSRKKTT